LRAALRTLESCAFCGKRYHHRLRRRHKRGRPDWRGLLCGASLDEMERIGAETSLPILAAGHLPGSAWRPTCAWKISCPLYSVQTFEELQNSAGIATTDINAGVSVYYSHARLRRWFALHAPTRVICAIQHDGRTLVDGFLHRPGARGRRTDSALTFVIAVYLERATSRSRARSQTFSAARSIFSSAITDLTWRTQAT